VNGTSNDTPLYAVFSSRLLTEFYAMKIFAKLQGTKKSNKFGSNAPSKSLTSVMPNKFRCILF